jgi:iron(III) transport system substrate-binding protein
VARRQCRDRPAEEVNLYSTREAPLVEPVIASFTATTGIKVNLTHIEDNLVKHVKAEGDTSPADVLMTIGLDKTSQFPSFGLTQTISSPVLDSAIPPQLRGAQWIALSVRPHVVMARADAALGAIQYEDLADPKWRGKLCMRSPLHQNNVLDQESRFRRVNCRPVCIAQEAAKIKFRKASRS